MVGSPKLESVSHAAAVANQPGQNFKKKQLLSAEGSSGGGSGAGSALSQHLDQALRALAMGLGNGDSQNFLEDDRLELGEGGGGPPIECR